MSGRRCTPLGAFDCSAVRPPIGLSLQLGPEIFYLIGTMHRNGFRSGIKTQGPFGTFHGTSSLLRRIMKKSLRPALPFAICTLFLVQATAEHHGKRDPSLQIGTCLELFVDDHLIQEMEGVELRLQTPVPAGTVLTLDRPWEDAATRWFPWSRKMATTGRSSRVRSPSSPRVSTATPSTP